MSYESQQTISPEAATEKNPGLKQHPRSNSKKTTAFLLLICVVMVVAGCLGARLVQTGFGTISVTGFRLDTENGQWITADLFKPSSATAENPVPLVIVCPGFERSKETMTSYSIELARRGMAVITIDPYNQGASSSTRQKRSATLEGYGIIPMVDHVCESANFDFIDKSRIGAAGYSAGGNAVLQSAAHFGARRGKSSRRQSPNAQMTNRLSAIFVGGYVLTMTEDVLANVHANVGMDYAFWDEGAFRTEKGSAQMRDAPEALRLVNSGLGGTGQVSEVDIGKFYGDAALANLRVVNNTKSIHPLMPYDARHVANVVEFFATVFKLAPPVGPSEQIWQYKELFTLLALAGAGLSLLPAAKLLLRLPVFRALVNQLPPPLPPLQTRGRIIFWTIFAGSALAACFLFIPLARATAVIFPDASASRQTWWFPQRINNALLLWAVANGLIGLAIFSLNYWLNGRKHGVVPAMWGIKTSVKELAATLGLTLTLFAFFYAMLFISYAIFHTDFRFTFVSAAAAFPAKMWLVALEYIPLFFVFYLSNSIRVNGAGRFAGQSEWAGNLINALANSVGLMLILAIQYIHLACYGAVYWKQEWLYTNLLLGVIPMMFILPLFNRFFFRLTGRVYLGPMVTCLIFIMMMLTGNVCYIPLN